LNKQEKKILLLIKLMPIMIGLLFFLSLFFIVFRGIIFHRGQAINDIKKSYIK